MTTQTQIEHAGLSISTTQNILTILRYEFLKDNQSILVSLAKVVHHLLLSCSSISTE
jgi:hypothetical protein